MKRLHPLLELIVLALVFLAPGAPLVQLASAQTDWYVATNLNGDGSSWALATNSIQGMIDDSRVVPADTVWVSNGVYEVGGITNYPSGTVLTNRVVINKAITVRSLNNDPTNTIIKGAWDPATTNGPAAVRCVWMTNGSTLIGFTLTNGATFVSGANVERGGGVSCESTNVTISNCVLTGNSAGIYGGGAIYGTLFNCTLIGNSVGTGQGSGLGGGVYGGILFNCTLTGNSATNGGGARLGTLTDCTLSGNSAKFGGGAEGSTLFNCMIVSNSVGSAGQGGGSYGGTLNNCTLIGNSAMWGGGVRSATLTNCTLIGNTALIANGGGGGAHVSTLYNCTLTGNVAGWNNGGGGAYQSTLYNCTVTSNSAGWYGGGGAHKGSLFNCLLMGNSVNDAGSNDGGGGARDATLYNCTIVGNSAANRGGGVKGGTLINSIVYFNSAPSGSNWYQVVTFDYTCTASPATNGVGNITSDPQLIDKGSGYGSSHVAGNYRLNNISPPLNAGTNFSWMTDPNVVHSKDLDGSRRIDNFSHQVDMGCYELLPRGTMFIMK